MIEEQTILATERLRDNLGDLQALMRKRYKSVRRQVTADEFRQHAARLAETWLVEISPLPAVSEAVGNTAIADLNVHFQRILTFSEHATTRGRYDAEFRNILHNYSTRIVVPLKLARGKLSSGSALRPSLASPADTVFIGQSFSSKDAAVNQFVFDLLSGVGLKVVTGERPKADRISDKVKDLIERQAIFVGIFTRRDKIARKDEWTTSAWVIDEKAYALGKMKPLILIKEEGVNSIGGIQGDYEYLEFSRTRLEILAVKLISLFSLTNNGLAS